MPGPDRRGTRTLEPMADRSREHENAVVDEKPKQTPVKVVSAEEPWSLVVLADGTRMMARLIISGAYRIENPNGGEPAYGLQHQVVVGMEAPSAEQATKFQ